MTLTLSEANRVAAGGREFEARNIVLATGSKPRPLDFPGAEHLATSDDVLNMNALPDSIVFIGGGVIALEFAHVLVRAGSRVTILEAATGLLPAMERGAVETLLRETERLGISIVTGVGVERIERMDEYENFWPAGAPSDGPDGVCGPCSEIFFHPNGIGRAPTRTAP